MFAQAMDHLPMHTFRRCVAASTAITILQTLSVTLFEKMPLDQLLGNLHNTDQKREDANWLKLQLD